MTLIDPTTATPAQRVAAAERTVAVLKRKVVELYDGTDASGVQAQIARMQQRQEEARRKRQLMAVRTAELARHNARLEAEVADRTRALRDILDNVTFGFLVVGRDGRVRSGFTRSCAELLGRPVREGLPLAEALGMDARQAMELELGLDQVFEDLMPDEVTLQQLPDRFTAGRRTLGVEGRALRDDDGAVSGVLFTINDLTPLLAARQESRHNARLVHLLRQRPAFEAFVHDTRALLSRCEDPDVDQATVRRRVHTVKGNAASFQLDEVAAVCHREEAAEIIDTEAIGRIHQAMRTVLASVHDVVGVPYDDDDHDEVRVDPRELQRLWQLLQLPDRLDEARAAARRLTQRPAADLLGPVGPFTQRLGDRLGKDVQLVAEGLDTHVDPGHLQPVLRTVSHLIRNAVDHGIEPEPRRGSKPTRGRIDLRVQADEQAVVVVVADDGAGIDTDALTTKAVAAGSLTAEAAADLDHAQRCHLVFEHGLSRADVATDISGRGVGMSAVREAVAAADGTITVESTPGKGTTFTLHIPHAA